MRSTERKQKKAGTFNVIIIAVFWAGLLLTCFSIPARAAVENIDDEDITSHVEMEFLEDSAVPSDAIDVVTTKGVVTLTGFVNNILAKDRAQQIAEETVGVRAVVNRITVLPSAGRSDEQIRQDVKDALLNDPAADSYEVDVKVDDGVVTLTGTVDSWQEKQLCGTIAEGVKGVVDVKNDILFDYVKERRNDVEIAQDIKERLAYDVRVDDALIKVSVNEGNVTLTGTVGSLQEKNQAVTDAWVRGVRSVNAEGLEIEWWARDRMRRKNMYVSQTDSEIRKAVKDAFFYDPRIVSFDIQADVKDGTVILSGVVDNLEARKAAEKDARNTMGVTRVINAIKVRPAAIPTNQELETKVSGALFKDPYMERFDLDVDAVGGTVYLFGRVDTSWEKNRATIIAQSVKGVVNVVNNIDFEHQWVWRPDWEIRDNVKDLLSWNPFVDGSDINVTVDNGIVTLTGTVATYSERQSAEINAYEAGAKDVDNDLAVTYHYYGPYYGTLYEPYNYMTY